MASNKVGLTVDRLREILHYNPDAGVFTRKLSFGRWKVGQTAGVTSKAHGYVLLRVEGVLFLSHRLAWMYVHGDWPPDQIDHINGIRHDNRISNLRSVTNYQNSENKWKAKKNNLTGLLGVSVDQRNMSYRATIKSKGVVHRLGTYETAEDAHEAYKIAKKHLHEYGMLEPSEGSAPKRSHNSGPQKQRKITANG